MPVHFLHIGKTGGTALQYALRSEIEAGRVVFHPHSTRLCDLPVAEPIVFFLREPVSRFVSAFNSRRRRGQPRYDVPWSADEARAFDAFLTPNDLAEALSADEFLVRRRARRAMRAIYHVRASLFDWFQGPEEVHARARDVAWIGMQEQLASDMEQLRMRLDLPAFRPLPCDDKDAHRTPSSMPRTLSPLGRSNIAAWFQDDLDLYAELLELRQRILCRPRDAERVQ